MKPKIRYILSVSGSSVLFQILTMDERFRKTDISNDYKASNGIVICSCSSPQLGRDTVYLWGNAPDKDNRYCTITFNTNEEAKVYAIRVSNALKEWSSHWEGFIEPETINQPGVEFKIYEH